MLCLTIDNVKEMYLLKRKVTKNGNSGHITLPADQVGTDVYVCDEETLLLLRGLRKK